MEKLVRISQFLHQNSQENWVCQGGIWVFSLALYLTGQAAHSLANRL